MAQPLHSVNKSQKFFIHIHPRSPIYGAKVTCLLRGIESHAAYGSDRSFFHDSAQAGHAPHPRRAEHTTRMSEVTIIYITTRRHDRTDKQAWHTSWRLAYFSYHVSNYQCEVTIGFITPAATWCATYKSARYDRVQTLFNNIHHGWRTRGV